MIRHFITLLLFFMLLVQTFQQGWIVIGYLSNTSLYERLCINKAKPAMHCNGRCQMYKKIKADTQEQQTPIRGIENSSLLIYSGSSFASAPVAVFTILSTSYSPLASGKPQDYPSFLLRPPAAA